jgi:long-chain alkane monooxygenase
MLHLVCPVLGETTEEAGAKYRRMVSSANSIHAALASVASVTDTDFSQFSLDRR